MPRRLPSGRWQGCVRLPGSSRRVTATFGVRRDAKAWEDEQRVALRRGDWRDPKLGRTLFDDWLARWLAARHVEPETAADDARTVARHLLPKWAGWPVGVIGRLEVQSWVTGMTRAGVGGPSVHKAYGLFASVMLAAAEEDLVGRTPCRNITLPEPAARRLAWWTPGQVEAILGVLARHHRVIAALMVWCGLRWEEAAGLGCEHVDWIRREITVCQVVTSGRRLKPYPKTVAGHRTVTMAGTPVAELLRGPWLAAVDVRGRSGLIWVAADGRPLSNRSWGQHWRDRVRDGSPGRPRPDVPYHSPHVLRHTGASWLAQAGVPLADVQRWLGHGDPDSTAVYAHLCPGRSNATIGEALAELATASVGAAGEQVR